MDPSPPFAHFWTHVSNVHNTAKLAPQSFGERKEFWEVLLADVPVTHLYF